MEKIILQGDDIGELKEGTIPLTLENICSLREGNKEIFIHAHGLVETKSELPNLKLVGFQDTQLLYALGLSNIGEKDINIFHIHSCHSGAAQNHIEEVPRNLILCTYIKPSMCSITYMSKSFIAKKIDQVQQNLSNYIIENLPALISVDFSISYKIENKVHKFSFNSDLIKEMTNITALPTFLGKEYKKFVEFYAPIENEYKSQYPEIFTPLPDLKTHTDKELLEVFSNILTLTCANYDQPSSFKIIENLLQQENIPLHISCVSNAIALKDPDLLTFLLAYKSTKLDPTHISDAIQQSTLKMLKLLLDHPSAKVEGHHILNVLAQDNPLALEKLKLLLPSAKVLSLHIYDVITQNYTFPIEKLKLLLDYISDEELESLSIVEAINNSNYEILFTFISHPKTTIKPFDFTYAIQKGNVRIVDMLIEVMRDKKSILIVEKSHIELAIKNSDIEMIKTLFSFASHLFQGEDRGFLELAKEQWTRKLEMIKLVETYYEAVNSPEYESYFANTLQAVSLDTADVHLGGEDGEGG